MSVNSDLIRCLNSYNKLLTLSYHFIIGRKNKTIEINIKFSKKECFHLLGLQYLSDIPQLNADRSKIYDELIKHNSTLLSKVINSDNYSKIESRVKSLQNLESFLDSNKTVFKFNNRANAFSLIEADYIMKNSDIDINTFLFISQRNDNDNEFFCRSFFPRSVSLSDYSKGHTSYTLLYKEKTNLVTNEHNLLFKSQSYNCDNVEQQNTPIEAKPLEQQKQVGAYLSRKVLKKSAQNLKSKEKSSPQKAHNHEKKHNNEIE